MLFMINYGEKKVFKYLHSIAAGHFSEQGKKLKNLAALAQQANLTFLSSLFEITSHGPY